MWDVNLCWSILRQSFWRSYCARVFSHFPLFYCNLEDTLSFIEQTAVFLLHNCVWPTCGRILTCFPMKLVIVVGWNYTINLMKITKKLEVRVSEFQTSKVNITNLKKYTKLLGNFIDTDILFYLLTCQKAAITCSLVNSWKRWPMVLSKLEMHTVELTMKCFQHFSLWKNFLIYNYLCDVLRDLVTFVQF